MWRIFIVLIEYIWMVNLVIKEIIKSVLVGIFGLLIINLVGQFFSFRIPFNLLTIVLFGFFRLPGLIIILIFLILWEYVN